MAITALVRYQIGADNRLLSDGTYDYAYDADGNCTERTDIATGAVTQYTWDTRNRLVTVADYAYNSAGQTTSETWYADAADANAGRNVENVIQYSYNPAGELTSDSDDGATDLYSYDSLGRPVSTTEQCPGAPNVVLAYQYDSLGRLTGTRTRANKRSGSTSS